MKILLIKRDNIGDLILTTPLIAELGSKYRLDCLVNSYNRPVLEGNPNVNRVYSYTKSHHREKGTSLLSVLYQRVKTILAIRCACYDAVVLCNKDNSSVRWAKLSGAKRIVALDENAADCVTDRISLSADKKHAVEKIYALGQAFGIDKPPGPLQLFVNPVEVERITRRDGIEPGYPIYGVQISARKEKQRWPVDRFVEMARRLAQHEKCTLLLFWSPGAADNPRHPGDDQSADKIIEACQGLPLKPIKTENIAQLMAGMSLCDQVLTSDGGALHIAVGVGRPVVALFGDSEAVVWRPWQVPNRVLEARKQEVVNLSVDEVYTNFIALRREILDSSVSKT